MRELGHPRAVDIVRVLSVFVKGGKVQEIRKVLFLMFLERSIDSIFVGFIKSEMLKEAGWVLKYGSLYRRMTNSCVSRHLA